MFYTQNDLTGLMLFPLLSMRIFSHLRRYFTALNVRSSRALSLLYSSISRCSAGQRRQRRDGLLPRCRKDRREESTRSPAHRDNYKAQSCTLFRLVRVFRSPRAPIASFIYGTAIRQYRYETLIAISAPLQPELVLSNTLTKASPKTYQVWHHRRLLLTALGDPAPELTFNEEILKADAKNYHTWSHRQWLLAHFDQEELWADELPFIDGLLADDVRNNSAWHHRFFVSFERGRKEGKDDAETIVKRELA